MTAALKQIDGPVLLDVPADPASLFLVRGVVSRLAERLDFSREEVERMVLAVDEACTNVIRYAYGERRDGGRISITFIVQPEALEIDIRDFGTHVSPETYQCRDLTDIRPGGLGVHFIRCAMDQVEYLAPPDGGTLLKLVKFRRSGEDSEK